jgi:hypothetical protein
MSRRPDAWLAMSADPTGADLDAALEALLSRLDQARAAATRVAGHPPLGLREVELAPGERTYLCAFEGPAFACVDDSGVAITAAHVVHRVATAGLMWEQLEAEVDASRLGEVAGAAGRVLALTDTPAAMCEAIGATVERVSAVAEWRTSPLRATASLVQVDVLFALHDRAAGAYARFVDASAPLVEEQDALDADLIAALGAFERTAIAAGLEARLAERLAGAIGACGQAADEIVAASVVALDGAGA